LFCWVCLRAWRYALTVLAAAAAGEGLCLTLVFLSGTPMNAILILMPPLVLVLTIASGVHLVSYYFDEARMRGLDDAPQRAIRVGRLPTVLATTTTAIGLSSLLVSRVDPIREFGGFATIGVFTTLALLFLLLPGVMLRWPAVAASHAPTNNRLRRFWLRAAKVMIGQSTLICGAAVLAIAALGWGLLSIETSVKLRDLFSPRDRVVAEYAWLEDTLGPMVPVEVVVHFPADTKLDFRRQAEFIQVVSSKVRELQEVDGVMSGATFALPFPRGRGARQVIRQTVITKRLVAARYLYEDDKQRAWRIMARVPALGDLDYAQFLARLRTQINPLIESASHQLDESITTTVTGALPLIYQTQQTLLADLIKSFISAFGVVAVMMTIVLRSVRAGLLAMIPNVFPTAVVFGLMGWLQEPIDIGSVMTASIALGIAVVDTLHFLTWFRREVAAGHTAQHAVRKAYLHCATPMVQTSLICGLGMLVFTFSSFMPASRFAWMVFILLTAALLGDLVILPAILAGPLGRVFVTDSRRA